MAVMPKTRLAKWSLGLTACYVLLITVFIIGVLLGAVTFDEGHAWDVTVAVAVPLMLSAFITGILALKHKQDHSVLSYLTIFINVCVIAFLLLHSLFIND